MTNVEILKKFEANSSYTFSTIDGECPESRIAHFLTADDKGIYFQTMRVKPFYRQLKENGKVSVSTVVTPAGAAGHDENGLPLFPPGYTIRVTGDVREIPFEELSEMAKKDGKFLPLVKDIERYPTMTTFVLYRFRGELYDYDFDKMTRDHKLERERFAFGGMEWEPAGFKIDADKCIACGVCAKVCTFSAIAPGDKYSIISARCDECGSCYTVCPVNAVIAKVPMDEESRRDAGKKILAYTKANHAAE